MTLEVIKNLPKNIQDIEKRVDILLKERLKKLAQLKGKNILELHSKEF